MVSTDIDVSGTLAEKADIKEFLLVRSSGRVEGHVNCGDVQVERGAVLAGGIFSVYGAAAQLKPVNDNRPANAAEFDTAAAIDQRTKITPPNRLARPASGATAHQGGGSCCGISWSDCSKGAREICTSPVNG